MTSLTPSEERLHELLRDSGAVEERTLDEALTSKAADERMREAGLPRDERRAWRDSYAALVLLEDWLSDGGVRGERVAPAPPPRG